MLVSEPMGTLLVNERMLETYLYARDHYLKPGALSTSRRQPLLNDPDDCDYPAVFAGPLRSCPCCCGLCGRSTLKRDMILFRFHPAAPCKQDRFAFRGQCA